MACNSATFWELSSTPERINTVPMNAPLIAPSGLNACEKFKRRAEVCDGPATAINVLEAVSRNASPLAITNKAKRKNG